MIKRFYFLDIEIGIKNFVMLYPGVFIADKIGQNFLTTWTSHVVTKIKSNVKKEWDRKRFCKTKRVTTRKNRF